MLFFALYNMAPSEFQNFSILSGKISIKVSRLKRTVFSCAFFGVINRLSTRNSNKSRQSEVYFDNFTIGPSKVEGGEHESVIHFPRNPLFQKISDSKVDFCQKCVIFIKEL